MWLLATVPANTHLADEDAALSQGDRDVGEERAVEMVEEDDEIETVIAQRLFRSISGGQIQRCAELVSGFTESIDRDGGDVDDTHLPSLLCQKECVTPQSTGNVQSRGRIIRIG